MFITVLGAVLSAGWFKLVCGLAMAKGCSAIRISKQEEESPLRLVPAAKLTSEEQSKVQTYLKACGSRSLLLGACVGKESWDLRPLVVEHGITTLCRFIDPKLTKASLQSSKVEGMLANLEKVQRLVAFSSFGKSSTGQLWIKRRFFKDVGLSTEIVRLSKSAKKQLFIQLVKQVHAMHYAGVVHGHISIENLAVSQERLFLLDPFYCSAYTGDFLPFTAAPELVNGGNATEATDIYGLGLIAAEFFPKLLKNDGILSGMMEDDPEDRPAIDEVVQLLQGNRVQKMQVRTSNKKVKMLRKTAILVIAVAVKILTKFIRIVFNSLRFIGLKRLTVISLVVAALFCVHALLVRFHLYDLAGGLFSDVKTTLSEEDHTAEFQALWKSGRLESMKEVAYAAVMDNRLDAQATIVAASLSQKSASPYVQYDLLKTAFNRQWLDQLGARDRRVVMTIALVRLLPKSEDLNLVSLHWVHPGIVYALSAHLPIGTGSQQFSLVSLEKMEKLPGVFGDAFRVLRSTGVKSMEEPEARGLSQVLAGNTSDEAIKAIFSVSDEISVISSKLALILNIAGKQEGLPERLKRIALNELPGGVAFTSWFNEESSLWDDITPLNLIIIAAGVAPEGLSVRQQADLIRFPVGTTRSSAARNLSSNPMYTRESKVIDLLATDKSRLTRKQTQELIQLLGSSSEDLVKLNAWLETNPDSGTLANILMERNREDAIDAINIAMARKLAQSEWKPPVDVLNRLVSHNEPLVRAFVYSRLDLSRREEREIASRMVKLERNTRLRSQLSERLNEYQ